MNREDLREYFKRVNADQLDQAFNSSSDETLLKEMSFDRNLPGALENLSADVQDMIDNAVGQVDLSYSKEPLTKYEVLDFVISELKELMEITPKSSPPMQQSDMPGPDEDPFYYHPDNEQGFYKGRF